MTAHENGTAKAAVACEGVWQVFGADAEHALGDALKQNDGNAKAAASLLRERGLIAAVCDVDFEVGNGELFVIMGLSGSGKSTLLRCISNLIRATAGRIQIEGEDLRAAGERRLIELRREKLGMVFQHFGLFPHMDVTENVAYPLRVKGVPAKERHARADEVIRLVGLEGRESAYPRELSGGQRQRVGIARSLAVDPSIWFLDEPFSALDPLIRRQLQDEFLRIQTHLKKSIVFVTHDIAEALKLADRIAIMRDGEIVQVGTPAEIVLRPADNYVRGFSRDVAKGKHACVDSIMRPLDKDAPGADDPGLRPNMTLDAALASCMSLYEAVPVRDDNGNVIGSVRPKDLVAALQVEDS